MSSSLVGGPKGERSAARLGAALCLLLAAALTLPPLAGAGSLDRGFGVHGRVVGPEAQGEEAIEPWTWGRTLPQTALAPDGDILLLGEGALARYLPDGSPDGSFGEGGVIDVPPAKGLAVDSEGRALVLLADPHDVEVIRYLPDGERDPSFGAAGVATTDLGQGAAEVCEGSYSQCVREERVEAAGIAVDAKDRPIVAAEGLTELTQIPDSRHSEKGRGLVGRLTEEGALDPTFGSGGVWGAGETGAAPLIDQASAGGPLVADRTQPGLGLGIYPGLGRLSSDGGSWTRIGPLSPGLGAGGFPTAVAAAPRGRALVLWGAYIEGEPDRAQPVVSRFLPDGAPDPSFGTHGKLVIKQPPGTTGPIEPTSVVALPGGGVAIAGTVKYAAVPERVAMLRLGPRGKPVLRNGNGGWLETAFGQISAEGRDLVLDEGGGLLAAAGLGPDRRPALVRYAPLPHPRR